MSSINTTSASNVATPQSTTSFPLLSLPLEIRQTIYHEFFRKIGVVINEPSNITFHRIVMAGTQHYSPWEHHGVNQVTHFEGLFMANKQIQQEARAVYYRSATFFFKRRWDFVKAFSRNSLCIDPGFFQNRLSGNIDSPFHYMKSLNLELAASSVLERPIHPESNRRVTEQIFDITTYSMPNLQHLQLEIDHHAILFDPPVFLKAWLLEALCRLRPRLETMLICIKGHHFDIDRSQSDRINSLAYCISVLSALITTYFYEQPERLPEIGVHNGQLNNQRELQIKIGEKMVQEVAAGPKSGLVVPLQRGLAMM